MSKIFFPQTISNAVFNIGSTALGGPQSQSDLFSLIISSLTKGLSVGEISSPVKVKVKVKHSFKCFMWDFGHFQLFLMFESIY